MNRKQRELETKGKMRWTDDELERVENFEELKGKRKGNKNEKALLAAILAFFIVYAFLFHDRNRLCPPPEGEMAMYSINVGDAESTFFIFPDGSNLLVDAGKDTNGVKVISVLKRLGVSRLDAVLISDTNIRHMGGFGTLLEKLGANVIYMSDYVNENVAYERIIKAAEDSGTPVKRVYAGYSFDKGGCRISILSPEKGECGRGTASCVVAKVEYRDVAYLLMSDADSKIEEELIRKYKDELKCTVLRVAHNGDNNSATDDFLNVTAPQVAVISANDISELAIPRDSAVSRIAKRGIRIYRTGRNGDIEILTDGKEIDIRTSGTTRENKISETVDKYIKM